MESSYSWMEKLDINKKSGTFLVAQWLKPHTAIQGV